MNVCADVALCRQERRSGMHTHAHADWPRGKLLRDRPRSFHCPHRLRERNEERVALRIDLDATVRGEGRSHDLPVAAQLIGVRFRPQFVEKACGTLDIREEECDVSRGKARHAGLDDATKTVW